SASPPPSQNRRFPSTLPLLHPPKSFVPSPSPVPRPGHSARPLLPTNPPLRPSSPSLAPTTTDLQSADPLLCRSSSFPCRTPKPKNKTQKPINPDLFDLVGDAAMQGPKLGIWILDLRIGGCGGRISDQWSRHRRRPSSPGVAVAVLPPSPTFVCGGRIGGWLGVIVRREESGEMRR
ncbi:unnamed protein product, partial [Linum tenue]